jgi:hypothetical protein
MIWFFLYKKALFSNIKIVTLYILNLSVTNQKMSIIEGSQMKVYLVDIVTKDTTQEILEDRMRELESLVATY